jgi:hypothetical protein
LGVFFNRKRRARGRPFNDLAMGDIGRFDLFQDDASGARAVQIVRPRR